MVSPDQSVIREVDGSPVYLNIPLFKGIVHLKKYDSVVYLSIALNSHSSLFNSIMAPQDIQQHLIIIINFPWHI